MKRPKPGDVISVTDSVTGERATGTVIDLLSTQFTYEVDGIPDSVRFAFYNDDWSIEK